MLLFALPWCVTLMFYACLPLTRVPTQLIILQLKGKIHAMLVVFFLKKKKTTTANLDLNMSESNSINI